MTLNDFLPYLAVMAGVTYLVRAIPFTLFKKKISNVFLRSFLYYTPYAVLASMTFPAIFYATENIYSAAVGIIIALVLALFEKSLLTVACGACFSVFITELIIKYV